VGVGGQDHAGSETKVSQKVNDETFFLISKYEYFSISILKKKTEAWAGTGGRMGTKWWGKSI
jgi:hypothetical protein